jgi:hypothetical protein
MGRLVQQWGAPEGLLLVKTQRKEAQAPSPHPRALPVQLAVGSGSCTLAQPWVYAARPDMLPCFHLP